jgi:proton-coupled amino acid transporter
MMLLKGYLGSGVLAMPYAFQQGGYLLGTIILTYYAVLIYRSTLLLL